MKIDSPDMIRFFGRHFVSLGMIDCPVDDRGRPVDRLLLPDGSIARVSDGSPAEKRIWSFSGFVISVGGKWFLVTAGHILADIESMQSRGERIIKRTVLIDSWGPNVISNEPIPFPFDDAAKYHFRDDDLGVDYGIIYLRPLIQANLQGNGVEPVHEANWKLQPKGGLDSYWMLGLPTQAMERRIGDSLQGEETSICMELVMIGLDRLAQVPDCFANHKLPQFYAKLLVDESDLQSIDGMSGGPILGFRRNPYGSGLYWIVGLQSGWLPRKRIICACPITPFAERLEAEVAAAFNVSS